jgi:hypothetical protein
MYYMIRHASGEFLNFTSDKSFQELVRESTDGFLYLNDEKGNLEKIVGIDYLRNAVISVSDENVTGRNIGFMTVH